MLWVKAFHIIAMVTWFAGLFYLPRLFVYHAMTEDKATQAQLKVMQRKLYYAITWPGGVTTIILGLWLLSYYPAGAIASMGWLHAKLTLVALLMGYHLWCGALLKTFQKDENTRSHRWYRYFNEAPTLLLIGIVILVVVKPF